MKLEAVNYQLHRTLP